jgi:hypothetical protein
MSLAGSGSKNQEIAGQAGRQGKRDSRWTISEQRVLKSRPGNSPAGRVSSPTLSTGIVKTGQMIGAAARQLLEVVGTVACFQTYSNTQDRGRMYPSRL